MENLKVITINSTTYLGELKEDKIINALKCEKEILENDLVEWLRKKNIKELYTIEIKGNITYQCRDLTESFKLKLKAYVAEFELVKEQALCLLQNSYFKQTE